MIRLLLDQGLPRSAVAVLQKVGWDVVHTFEVGLSRAADVELLEVARRASRTVVTLDADFHALLAVANANSPSVIRIQILKTAIGARLARVQLAPRIRLLQAAVQVEP